MKEPIEPKSVATSDKAKRTSTVTVLHPRQLPLEGVTQHKRILEALLFAATEPLDEESLSARLPQGADVVKLLALLANDYANRGVSLVRIAGKWAFRTAEDLKFIMQREAVEQKYLSKAALETLSIIAYHQPATRAEVEAVRGVSVSKGTVDVLLETGWIRMRGRRRSPGKPVIYVTTDHFLNHFGLDTISELPGFSELQGAGLLDGNLPPGFEIPMPSDDLLGPDDDMLSEDNEYDTLDPLIDLED